MNSGKREEGPLTEGSASRDALASAGRRNDILEEEGHYRTLFAAVTDAIFVHELGEDGLPGRFLEVNDVACERLGYSREELLTLSPLDIDAPDTGIDPRPIGRKVLAGERVTFEQIHVAKDGRRIAVEISAQGLKLEERPAVLSLARDITERKNAEQALRESTERYRLLTELSPNAVTVTDTAGTIRMLNQRSRAIYGHENDSEVIGKNVFEWVPASDRKRAAEALQELFRDGISHSAELNLQRKDGSLFRAEVNASFLRDAAGHPQEIIFITTDLTPRLQMEEERLKLQKLEAVGRLAGGIAHDFNNLLQGVFGYLSLAKRSLDRPEQAAAMLDQASQALGMSINLTSQLLTFAKGGQPVRKILAVGPIIENAAKFALAGSSCDLRLSLAKDLSPINADEGQIGQAIQNIILNANQAMPEGGNIEVAAGNADLPPGKLKALTDGGRFIKITIRDAGIGIPKKYLTRIFDPYFTTKQIGSGLGLATTFSIIKKHGGTIEVTSKPNLGSCFTVFLPAVFPESPQEERAKVAPAASRRGKILVMDDDEMIRTLAIQLAQVLGHEIETAVEGAEAVEKFIQAQQAGRPFDLVLLDLTVKGGMGGEAAIKKIRKVNPDVKAVVSSGYADNPVVADFQAYGFSAALNKPYEIDELEVCLNSLLAER